MSNYQPTPTPELRVVTFRLELPGPDTAGVVNGLAQGHSPNRRVALWSEANVWTESQADLRHEPADWVHHLALTALQDRPNTTERLLFGLTGGLGVQEPLF